MQAPYLSVVIPSYNEEENFKKGTLEEVAGYLEKQSFSWEVILVDDGSIDKTLKLLSEFAQRHKGFRLISIKHGGKFKAVAKGVGEAKGEIILFSDFDQSTPIREFNKFLPHFRKGADIVIGSRMGPETKRIADRPFRYFRSRVLNFIIQLFLFRGIGDTQCGFKAFKSEVGKQLFKDLKVTHLTKASGGFMGPFDIELLFLARKLNYKIVEVPVVWQYFPSKRLSVLAEPIKFVFDILRIKLFDILGTYKK